MITYPGHHWYTDSWGPDDTPSLLNLSIYTVGFRDAMSYAIWLYDVKSKETVLDCLKDVYDKVIQPKRVYDGLKAFTIQSDNGEFMSNAVLDFLHSVGGERLTCCASSPEAIKK